MVNADPVALSVYAMGTRFEIALHGGDPARLRTAGEEALREIERLDAQLSCYRPDSEVSWINARAAREPVKVEPRLFRLLRRCAEITVATDGAFDITIAPLLHAWGFTGDCGRVPDEAEIEAARRITGMGLVELDEENLTIRFAREGMRIDLGAVGKGYAIEMARDILLECRVASGIFHGGTSTICAIGVQPDGSSWKVAVRHPTDPDALLKVVPLENASLSVSAVHGKSFIEGGREFGHVIDPRIGRPVEGALAAVVIGPSPTECDALSTALLALGEPGLNTQLNRHGEYSGFVMIRPSEGMENGNRLPA